MLAGMNWITEPKIVAAVCNAGALGVFAMAHCSVEEARKSIKEIKSLTDKPFGVNQILNVPLAKEKLEIAMEENVPIINYALGKPWFIDQVHSYGGKVIGTIATAKHASRAEELGVDVISITGHEAAAHGLNATSLVLIPIVTSWSKIPLIAAGGFFDGRGLAAALMLGADAVSMGTRFVLSKESIAHEKLKQACLDATEEDTLYSDVFDGLPSRVLKNKAAESAIRSSLNIPGLSAISGARKVKHMLNLSMWAFLRSSVEMMMSKEKRSLREQALMASATDHFERAIYRGDVEEGWILIGQCCGAIKNILSCREIIENTVAQAEELLAKAASVLYHK